MKLRLLLIVLLVPSFLFSQEWSSAGGGASRSGYLPISFANDDFEESWIIDFGSKVKQVSLGGGLAFVSPGDDPGRYGWVAAVEPVVGGIVWAHTLADESDPNVDVSFVSQSTFHSGSIFLQKGERTVIGHTSYRNDRLLRLDASSGEVVWSSPYEDQWPRAQAPCVADGKVWIDGGTYGGVYGFDATDGSELFFVDNDNTDGWTPAYSDGQLYTYVYGSLHEHDLDTGEVLWSEYFGRADVPNIHKRFIVSALRGGKAALTRQVNGGLADLLLLDTETNTLEWSIDNTFYAGTTPAISPSAVYGIGTYGEVHAYNLTTGEFVITFDTNGALITRQPIVTENRLILSSDTQTFVFDISSAELLQIIEHGGDIAVSENALFISSETGLRCYRIKDPNNHRPVALDLFETTGEEQDLLINLSATDADEDSLVYVIDSLPPAGQVFRVNESNELVAEITEIPYVIGPSGRVIYRPNENLFGIEADGFDFKVSDGKELSSPSRVTIDVTAINDPPVSKDDRISVYRDTPIQNYFLQNNDYDVDGDLLTLVAISEPQHGDVVINPNGSITYTPNPGTSEVWDEFEYTVEDPHGIQSTSRAYIHISDITGSDWPTNGRNFQRSGDYPRTLGSEAFVQLWDYAVVPGPDELIAPPNQMILHEGNGIASYTVDGRPYITVLDGISGSELWTWELPQSQDWRSMGPPSIHDGVIYFCRRGHNSDSQLWAVEFDTGLIKWITPISAQWGRTYSPYVSQDRVWIEAGSFSDLYSYDRETGQQLSYTSLPVGSFSYRGFWTPSAINDRLFTHVGKTFREHDSEDGEALWSIDLGDEGAGDMEQLISISGNRAFVLNKNEDYSPDGLNTQKLISLNLDSREVEWQAIGEFNGSPTVLNDSVYAINGTDVVRFSVNDGSIQQVYSTGDVEIDGQPLVTFDRLFVASNEKTYIFNLGNSQLVQILDFGGILSMAKDTLFISGDDAHFQAWGKIRTDPVGVVPMAVPQNLEAIEDTSLLIQLSGVYDSELYSIETVPQSGTLYQTLDGVNRLYPILRGKTAVVNPDGLVIYEPAPNENGSGLGNFTFKVRDAYRVSEASTVTINVISQPDPPKAVNDSRWTPPYTVIPDLMLLINDNDPDCEALAISGFTQPQSGQLTLDENGIFSYDPLTTPPGTELEFDYTISDESGLQASGMVSIIVDNETGREWRRTGKDAARTNFSPIIIPNGNFSKNWTYTPPALPTTTLRPWPAQIYKGRAYFEVNHQYDEGGFLSVDLYTGNFMMRTVSGMWARTLTGQPAFVDDSIISYVFDDWTHSNFMTSHSLDGQLEWTVPIEGWYGDNAISLLDYEGYVYKLMGGVTYPFDFRYRFSHETGESLKKKNLAGQPVNVDRYWGPSGYDGYLYTMADERFTCYDLALEEVWSLEIDGMNVTGSDKHHTLAIDNGLAFFIVEFEDANFYYDSLVCVDLEERQVKWRKPHLVIDGRKSGQISNPAVEGGIVYIGTLSVVLAFDTKTGIELGRFYTRDAEDWVPISISLTVNRLIACSRTTTYIFDRFSYELLQVLPIAGASITDDVLIGFEYVKVNRLNNLSFHAYEVAEVIAGDFAEHSSEATSVTLTSSTNDGLIYYTDDGSAPDSTSRAVSSGETINILSTGTITASVFRDGVFGAKSVIHFSIEDQDGDNLPDWWENLYVPSLNLGDALGDYDFDGVKDIDEYNAGTDPTDPKDKFSATHSIPGDGQTFQLNWHGQTGRHYQIEESTNLQDWTVISDWMIGTNSPMNFNDSIEQKRFYRIKVSD